MKGDFKIKRILYYYLRGATAGGSDTCLFLLVKNLDRSKYEPVVLYRDKSLLTEQLQIEKVELIQLSNKIRLKLHKHIKNAESRNKQTKSENISQEIKIKKRFFIRVLASNLKHITRHFSETLQHIIFLLKNRIDIVHANHDISGDHPMILASLILRKKVFCHNRGIYNPKQIDVYLTKYIDKIICISDFSKNVYLKNKVKEEKCITIYDGIDTEQFKPSKIETNEKIIISCIGRLEVWKGQQILIDAAENIIKSIPNIVFYLVGDGDNFEALNKQVKEKELDKYFVFTGHVNNVVDYINKSAIIVHTSIIPEPFGMVILEAMALEKVVIATDFGGPKEIISNGIDGFLIPAENSQELSSKILDLIKNPDRLKKMGKEARETVIRNFDVKKNTKQIQNLYETNVI